MVDPIVPRVSIPSMDFRGSQFVNEDGTLTESAQGFLDLLYRFLVKNVGEEGLVSPTQTTTNRNVIEGNTVNSPTGDTIYTCQFGTILYDSTDNALYAAVDDGTGVPEFKEISLI